MALLNMNFALFLNIKFFEGPETANGPVQQFMT